MSCKQTSVNSILDDLDALAEGEDDVTIDDVVEALGGRGFGPLILLPALLVITPLGGIPGFPTVMAVLILLFAVQVLAGKQRLWVPGFLGKRGVSDDRVRASAKKLRPVGRWLDDHMGQRLDQLVSGPMPKVAAGVIMALCLLVPPSEVLPFAAFLPMGAIALLALALTLRDGVVMLLGLILSAVALYLVWSWAI